jgi:hypothetical protein
MANVSISTLTLDRKMLVGNDELGISLMNQAKDRYNGWIHTNHNAIQHLGGFRTPGIVINGSELWWMLEWLKEQGATCQY